MCPKCTFETDIHVIYCVLFYIINNISYVNSRVLYRGTSRGKQYGMIGSDVGRGHFVVQTSNDVFLSLYNRKLTGKEYINITFKVVFVSLSTEQEFIAL
jgi:hypothetical protein